MDPLLNPVPAEFVCGADVRGPISLHARDPTPTCLTSVESRGRRSVSDLVMIGRWSLSSPSKTCAADPTLHVTRRFARQGY